jgi:hypothetical protein
MSVFLQKGRNFHRHLHSMAVSCRVLNSRRGRTIIATSSSRCWHKLICKVPIIFTIVELGCKGIYQMFVRECLLVATITLSNSKSWRRLWGSVSQKSSAQKDTETKSKLKSWLWRRRCKKATLLNSSLLSIKIKIGKLPHWSEWGTPMESSRASHLVVTKMSSWT